MENIKKYIFIALLAIFAVACTNEEDFTDSKNSKVNNKNLDKSDFLPISPFPEYEKIDITEQQAQDLLVDFNKAMNNEISMPDMEIKQALLAMEMYFNYAIVDKNTDYDVTASYEEKSFEFTVNVDDAEIYGDELKTKYRQFLIGIKNEMSNKFMKFSDLFVSSKTDNTITFKIIIPPHLPFAPEADMLAIGMHSCSVVREVGDIPNVANFIHIDIGDYVNNGQPITPDAYSYSLPQLRSLCLKPLFGFVYGITSFASSYFIGGEYYTLFSLTYPHFISEPYPYFNNEDFENILIPATLNRADIIRQSLNDGLKLLDININMDFRGYIGLKSSSLSTAVLIIDNWMQGTVVRQEPTIRIDDIIFNL
ncbi:hypothetical protein SDC9_12296 [bioreactor metagenome]|uniref:Uncharacterized protein n=1 Tax=bioreactor metagenome TaxID=1076179 RepID=A0A644TIT6_9ZZZZ